jgi:parallel beta-helix repeat protein
VSRLLPAASAAALLCAVSLISIAPAHAAVTCAKVASPSGSDSAAGTAAAPYRTAQKLADATGPGQTGCLRAGNYAEDVWVSNDGLTITSYPGERATLTGRLVVGKGADDVTFTAINIDGANAARLPSPTVNGDRATFRADDVTNGHTDICFVIGSSWGRAHGTVLQGNRIHDCGKIPSSNQDHGIYVSEADDTQILDNVIYDNVDRGIQLYPDAQRTVVRGNIIDGNGEGIIFSGADGAAASDTIVEGNIVSNSRIRTNVESWYPAGNPIGARNVVRNNCLWQGAGGLQNMVAGGFTMTDNLTADPQFVDRAAGDFRLKSGSRCATILATSQAPAGAGGQSPVTGAPADPGTTTPPSTGGGTATPPTSGGGSGTPTTPPATGGGSSTPTTPPSTGTVKKVWHCVYVRVNGKRVRRCSWVPVTQAKAAVVRTTSRAAKPKRAKTAKAVKHRRRSAR